MIMPGIYIDVLLVISRAQPDETQRRSEAAERASDGSLRDERCQQPAENGACGAIGVEPPEWDVAKEQEAEGGGEHRTTCCSEGGAEEHPSRNRAEDRRARRDDDECGKQREAGQSAERCAARRHLSDGEE